MHRDLCRIAPYIIICNQRYCNCIFLPEDGMIGTETCRIIKALCVQFGGRFYEWIKREIETLQFSLVHLFRHF
jgi:hypothetical protein